MIAFSRKLRQPLLRSNAIKRGLSMPRAAFPATSAAHMSRGGSGRLDISNELNVSQPFGMPIRRPFSTELANILSQEISDELANEEIDQELEDITKQLLKSFKLKDTSGYGIVRLTKQHKDEVIEVEFDCQNAEDSGLGVEDLSHDGDGGEEEDEDELGDETDYGINFDVTIKRGDHKLIVDCLASDSLEVRNVRVVAPEHASEDLMKLYGGPRFEDLDEALQRAFYDYLTERQIDDDLSFFVLAYSREKEQREYVNWLEKMMEITVEK